MSDSTINERPTAITVICLLGLVGALVAVPLVFSSIARAVGTWYPPYLAFASLVGAICMAGLWFMKKWAVYAYAGFVLVNQVVMLSMGIWNIFALLIPAVVIFFSFTHVKAMS